MPRAVRRRPPAGMEQTVSPQAGEPASPAGARRAQLPRYLHQLHPPPAAPTCHPLAGGKLAGPWAILHHHARACGGSSSSSRARRRR